ncbi:MAG: hypothetical protein ACTHM1_03015 [Solirubrobacteraceae bacterium]
MSEDGRQKSRDSDGERVRRLRLRADGERSPAVNLQEAIVLSRKLFELRDAAQRTR